MAQARSYKAEQFLKRLPKKMSRQVVTTLVGCVHCGMCTDSCHYVLANPDDPTYAPAHKADQLRKIFKRHIDWTGRIFPWWVHAESVHTDEQLEELKDIAFGKCTNCRRCTINCPMGVDFATANRTLRGLLVHVGVMPEGVAVVSKDQWELGNQMGVLKEDYIDTVEWMSEEVVDELEDDEAEITIDRKGAKIMYTINPREVKYDPRTISDAAKIFYEAGEDWTMPSEGWDMTNFGLFSGDDDLGGTVAKRVYEKAEELGIEKVVISECGHGYRSTRCEGQNWGAKDINFVMESSVDTMLNYIKEGKIKVDKTKNSTPVTFHDSCNNARSCGLYEEPRELLKLVCMDFREMYPNRAENFCCTGGGGAMSMSEYSARRLKSAKIKADQLKATGAGICVTSCHNCVDGLNDCIKHWDVGQEVTQLVNLVANALVPVRALKAQEAAKAAEAKAAEAKAEEKKGEEKKGEAKKDLEGYKILVVDDEPDQRVFLTTVMEDNGAEVLEASDAEEAMKIALAEKPDLITLDLGMPGKGGAEFYMELRNSDALKETPVCIVTGKPELRKLIYERTVAAPEGYLDKPVADDKLVLNIRKIFETKRD